MEGNTFQGAPVRAYLTWVQPIQYYKSQRKKMHRVMRRTLEAQGIRPQPNLVKYRLHLVTTVSLNSVLNALEILAHFAKGQHRCGRSKISFSKFG